MIKGVSDLHFISGNGFHSMELKTKGGRPSPEQVEFLKLVEEAGQHAAICRGYEEAIAQLEKWWLIR